MTTTTQAPWITAENVIALHEQAAAMPVLLTGVLDAKIAEVKTLLADLAARQGIVDTLEAARKEAASIVAKAKTSTEQTLAAAEAKMFDATSQQTAAQQALDDANARQSVSVIKAQELTASIAKAEKDNAARKDELAQIAAKLDAGVKDLAAREAELAANQEKLKADRAEINRRLEALRVVEA